MSDRAPTAAASFAHNRSLDGLRGIAVLLVVVSHGTVRLTAPDQRFAGGAIGVGLFFVLSGYLITSLLLRERAATGRISLRDFYVRRALRIWPLYYGVLALHLLVLMRIDARPYGGTWLWRGAPTHDGFDGVAWSYVVFLQNYVASIEQVKLGLGVYWSLAIEEQFYVFWPPVVILLTSRLVRRRLALPAVLLGAVVVSFLLRAWTIQGHLPGADHNIEWMTHTNLFGLAGGSLLAWLRWDADARGRGAGAGSAGSAVAAGAAWAGWGVVAVLLLRRWVPVIESDVVPGLPHLEYYEPLLLTVAVMAIVNRVVTCEWQSSPLRWLPLVYVGRVSFGVYLLHPIVLGIVVSRLDGKGWVEVCVFVAASVAVAAASYELFEKRALRLKKRFSHVGRPVESLAVSDHERDEEDRRQRHH